MSWASANGRAARPTRYAGPPRHRPVRPSPLSPAGGPRSFTQPRTTCSGPRAGKWIPAAKLRRGEPLKPANGTTALADGGTTPKIRGRTGAPGRCRCSWWQCWQCGGRLSARNGRRERRLHAACSLSDSSSRDQPPPGSVAAADAFHRRLAVRWLRDPGGLGARRPNMMCRPVVAANRSSTAALATQRAAVCG